MSRLLIASLCALGLLACDPDSPTDRLADGGFGGSGGRTDGGAGGAGGSEEPQPGGSGGVEDPPASMSFAFDFGPQVVGRSVFHTFIVENPGSSTAHLSFSEMDGVAGVRAWPQEIPARGRGEVELAFHPLELGPAEGSVRLDMDGTTLVFSLRGTGIAPGDVSCLEVSPGSIAFGSACGTEALPVTVTNRCDLPAGIQYAFVEGSGFRVQPFPHPAWIQPGASMAFVVEHRVHSEHRGGEHALLALQVVGGGELVVELDAAAVEPMPTQELFDTPERPRIDSLFVVDQSVAVEPFRSRLAELGRSQFEFLKVTREADFRVLVTSTSLADGCTDVLPRSETGAVAIERGTSTGGELFADALLRAADCAASGPDQGLEAARQALLEGPDAGTIARDDAHLGIVFVSARDDASPDPVADYVSALLGIKAQSHMISAHAVIPGACEELADAERYMDATEELGGHWWSACASDWSDHLEVIGQAAIGKPVSFFLRHAPADSDGDGAISYPDELAVLVDGVDVPPVSQDGTSLWSYDAANNAVRFAEPQYGVTIEIRYAAWCPN